MHQQRPQKMIYIVFYGRSSFKICQWLYRSNGKRK